MKLILTPTDIIYEPTDGYRKFQGEFVKHWLQVANFTIKTKHQARSVAMEIAWRMHCDSHGLDPKKKANEVVTNAES